MKRTCIILLTAVTALLGISCNNPSDSDSTGGGSNCGTHNGKTLYIGPQGGCYYINSSGNKTYVDRSECDC